MEFVTVCFVALLSFVSVNAMASEVKMKRVLVTGANKGIGKAICESLLANHPDIFVLLGSRDLGRGEKAVKDLRRSVGAAVCDKRLELVQLDTSSDESVSAAAKQVAKGGNLFGIVNNAAIGFDSTLQDTVNTNYFGPRRVNDAFGKFLQRPGGRIVNLSSASGPMFVSGCSDRALRQKLGDPTTIGGGIEEVDQMAKTARVQDAYGFSKALLSAYTALHAQSEPTLLINACTPGYINTDMTRGYGATNPPSKGAIPPVWLLTSPDVEKVPTGRYYGSDCVRSPLHTYRGPGDPPYEGP